MSIQPTLMPEQQAQQCPTCADEDRPGSGFMRDIPEDEVTVLELMVPLVRDGLTPSRAVLVARALAAGETPTLGGLTLTSPPAAQEIPA